MERVEISPFADAVGVLAEIIVRYLRASGLRGQAEDLFERDALVWLAATMATDGDVRKALHAVDDAAVKALEDESGTDRVTLAVAQSIAPALNE